MMCGKQKILGQVGLSFAHIVDVCVPITPIQGQHPTNALAKCCLSALSFRAKLDHEAVP